MVGGQDPHNIDTGPSISQNMDELQSVSFTWIYCVGFRLTYAPWHIKYIKHIKWVSSTFLGYI